MKEIMPNSDFTLFIIWEKARVKEKEILLKIESEFQILQKYEIQWSEEKFLNNLSSFYSDDVYHQPTQKKMRGTGPFLAVLCLDEKPLYEKRETNHGTVLVNIHTLDFKTYIRKTFLNGGFTFHASDDLEEAKHDVVLLTGKSINDILKTETSDKVIFLKQNLPCVDGWKSMSQVFYVLNEACNYVVLWGHEKLPHDFISHERDGDIDLLTDNLQRLISVLRDNNDLRTNAFVFYNWLEVGGEKNLFHAKFVGDDYFDRNWQIRQLERRYLNKNGIYVLNDEMQFYSLLYHGLIHKVNYKKYEDIFKRLSDKLKLTYQDDIDYLKNLLYRWMKFYNYKYTKHLDHGVLHNENVVNRKLLKKKADFYLFRNKWGTSVFNSELIRSHPEIATSLAFRFSQFIELKDHLLPYKSKLFKVYRHDLKQNTLFVTYTKRYGKIGRTKCYCKNNRKWIKKDFIGLKQSVRMDHLILHGFEPVREFINQKSVYQILAENVYNTKKPHAFKYFMELFIQELFVRFESKHGNKLKGCAFDMLPQNCIIVNGIQHDFHFFDFEYEFKGEMDKSYMIYRIVQHLYFDFDKKAMYDDLCRTFNVPNTWAWCASFDKPEHIFKDIEKEPLQLKIPLWKLWIANSLSFLIGKQKKVHEAVLCFLTPNQKRYKKYFKY